MWERADAWARAAANTALASIVNMLVCVAGVVVVVAAAAIVELAPAGMSFKNKEIVGNY